jgi:ribose-phosphate pyrophosphokinase
MKTSNPILSLDIPMAYPVSLIVGNSNRALFASVAQHATALLENDGFVVNTILPRTSASASEPNSVVLEKFSNGEIHVDIGENLRGHTVYIMQTEDNSPAYTANDYFMELVLLISACRLASAGQINVLMPSYFYARQDKKDRPRVPISAKTIANILQGAGADRIIVVDLHSAQTQGFFDKPVDNLYAIRYLREHLEMRITESILAGKRARTDYVLISPDLGGEKRIVAYSAAMQLPYVTASKTRDHTKSSVIEDLQVYGAAECNGKIGIVVDDMIDTAGTVVALMGKLATCGFSECWVVVTHGILSGKAVDRLNGCALITRVICTNTLDRQHMSANTLRKLEIVDISKLLARAIFAIETNNSISALFEKTTPPTPLLRSVPVPRSVTTPTTLHIDDIPPFDLSESEEEDDGEEEIEENRPRYFNLWEIPFYIIIPVLLAYMLFHFNPLV